MEAYHVCGPLDRIDPVGYDERVDETFSCRLEDTVVSDGEKNSSGTSESVSQNPSPESDVGMTVDRTEDQPTGVEAATESLEEVMNRLTELMKDFGRNDDLERFEEGWRQQILEDFRHHDKMIAYGRKMIFYVQRTIATLKGIVLDDLQWKAHCSGDSKPVDESQLPPEFTAEIGEAPSAEVPSVRCQRASEMRLEQLIRRPDISLECRAVALRVLHWVQEDLDGLFKKECEMDRQVELLEKRRRELSEYVKHTYHVDL